MPTLQLDHRTIGYADDGAGEPVILVHGSAASRRFWQAVAAPLARTYRVLALDLHGYGETSPWPMDRLLAPEDEGALIDAVGTLCGGRFHLVGHSYGGAIAAEYAIRHPGRLLSLALVEPSAFNLLQSGAGGGRDEIEDLAIRHIAMVMHGRAAEAAELFMTYWVGPEAWHSMPDHRRAAVVRAMPKVAVEWRLIFFRLHGLAAYACLPVPTTLLCGSATKRPSRSVVDVLRVAMPAVRHAGIDGAGHMAPLTHPGPVAAAIARHLAEVAPASMHHAA